MSQRAQSPADSFFSSTTANLVSTMPDEQLHRTLSGASAATAQRPVSRQSSLVEVDTSSSSAAPISPTKSTDPVLASAAPVALTKTRSRATEHSVFIQQNEDVEAGLARDPEDPSSLRRDHSGSSDDEDTLSLKERIDRGEAGSIAIAGEGLGVAQCTYPPSVRSVKGEHSGSASTDGSQTLVAPPPDGGLRAWLNVLGGWLVLFSTFGYVNAFGVYQSYYKQARFPEKSASDISWIGSVQLCLFFLMALVAGPMFDKGRFRLLIALGSVLWIVSVFLIPQVSTYGATMGVQGVLGGVGNGLLFLPSLSIQSHWFAKRRNLAIGIVASGSSLGGIAFPIMLNKLFTNPDVGFANGVRDSGYVIVACLVVANAIMSPNPARKNIAKPKPAPFKQLFSAPYSCLAFGSMILNFGLWFPNFYIQVYGQANGLDQDLAFYLLAIFNAGSFFGRTVPNVIADYTGPFLVQSLCCLGAGIVLFFMQLMTSPAAVVVFAALYGFLSGGFISLVSPVIVSMSKDLSEIGLRQGIAFLIVAGAAVGGNPIAGKLLAENNNDFLHPILFSGTMATVGALVIATGCLILMKQKGTWRV
ncbi:hypothetical protein JCM10213_000274 [Rhodosporidiobolus nylandii]